MAELDGAVAAAMAAFPVGEAAGALARVPAPGAARHAAVALAERALRSTGPAGARAPAPPRSAFYVDALATDPALRRRGAARALLAAAEREARARGLRAVALDTTVLQRARAGPLRERGLRRGRLRARPAGGLPGFVALVKPLR